MIINNIFIYSKGIIVQRFHRVKMVHVVKMFVTKLDTNAHASHSITGHIVTKLSKVIHFDPF